MNLLCKFSDSVLLLNIEFSLIYAVSNYLIAKLASCELVKNKALLTCVDNLSVVESLKLLGKLSFLSELLECCKDFVVNLDITS